MTQHSRSSVDEYYWRRYREDLETIPYLKAENVYLEEVLVHTQELQNTAFTEVKSRIPESDPSAELERSGYFYWRERS